jgi:hypothetical protein
MSSRYVNSEAAGCSIRQITVHYQKDSASPQQNRAWSMATERFFSAYSADAAQVQIRNDGKDG